MGWNLEQTAAICRERIGGGSYLSHSIIPDAIPSAHSGMTAEGDNRVLMQKVVKDIFTDVQNKAHRTPKLTMDPRKQQPKILNQEAMTNMIYYKEQAIIKAMGGMMQKKLAVEGKKYFDVWMYEVSDEIQALATAFGERFMLEQALAATAAMSDNKAAQKVMEKAIFLYSALTIKKDLGWYTLNGAISNEAAANMDTCFD